MLCRKTVAEGSNPDLRPVLVKYNHWSLSLKPDSLDVNDLQEIDMKKIEALKKAVSAGTYTVPAEDLAPKLMESMFQNTILDETPIGASVSQLEVEDHYRPQRAMLRKFPAARW
jgi:hypothetical protein